MTRKRLRSDLDGKTWSRYSISIWSDIEKDGEEKKIRHPAMFPKALAGRLIEIFTRPGDTVLDVFAGSGSTLLAAVELGRSAVGFELNPEYCELARARMAGQSYKTLPVLFNENALNLKKHLSPRSIDFCFTSPPYWNILTRKRTADFKETRDYGELPEDLGKITDYSTFVKTLGHVFAQVHDALKPGAYLVVNVMDIRKKSRFFPFHMDLTLELQSRGYILDDIIIWDRRREYNNLRPLGYPYVFRVNKVHEFLLIFQKPPA